MRAPAKLNLTLRIIGRRADGYHELESLVAFAGLCDWLGFDAGKELTLEVFGPRAQGAGPDDKNLVVRAAHLLAAEVPTLRLGRFQLVKRLPAAAGLGGGSSDAAAALRLLATQIGLSVDDPRVLASARATGADVLACLSPRAKTMRGIGYELAAVFQLPDTFAVLVNPRVDSPTPQVFAALNLATDLQTKPSAQAPPSLGCGSAVVSDCRALGHNDLEAAAIRVAPQIEGVLRRLAKISGAKAFGMSGSGATCFALFDDRRSAAAAQRSIAADHPEWWVEATRLH